MKPVIGIPPTLDSRGRWREGREYHYIDGAYAAAVDACGGMPFYIPMQAKPAQILDHLDGLLIPGGDDFVPNEEYPPEVVFDQVPRDQLDFDAALLAEAWGRDKPVLGICYGMQLLALHDHGELLYDIPTDRPSADAHRLEPEHRHDIAIEDGTLLGQLLGGSGAQVNSWHHQGVESVGESLRVSARADDGIVEAIEAPSHAFCLGVQWHPEKMDAAHRDAIIGGFVRACSA